MVCHETYKDQNNKWLSPEEVTSENGKNFKKETKSKVIGPSESMSKSKKNVIDPENMIKHMGQMLLDGLFYLTALQKKI